MAVGEARLAAGDPLRAISAFRTAILQDSLNADALAGLSRVYEVQKKMGLADVYMRRAQAIAYESGVASLENGHLEKAREAFQYTLEMMPWHPLALIRLGEIAAREERAQEAIEYFERAAAANPQYAESFIRLGNLHALSRDYVAARTAYERAIAVNINAREAYMGLGDLLSSEGKWAAAAEQYQNVLLIDPESSVAKSGLNRVKQHL